MTAALDAPILTWDNEEVAQEKKQDVARVLVPLTQVQLDAKEYDMPKPKKTKKEVCSNIYSNTRHLFSQLCHQLYPFAHGSDPYPICRKRALSKRNTWKNSKTELLEKREDGKTTPNTLSLLACLDCAAQNGQFSVFFFLSIKLKKFVIHV